MVHVFCFVGPLILLPSILFFMSAPVRAIDPPSLPIYGVRMEQAWIPMKDGVRLAATLYMPDGAKAGEKFPLCSNIYRTEKMMERRRRIIRITHILRGAGT